MIKIDEISREALGVVLLEHGGAPLVGAPVCDLDELCPATSGAYHNPVKFDEFCHRERILWRERCRAAKPKVNMAVDIAGGFDYKP